MKRFSRIYKQTFVTFASIVLLFMVVGTSVGTLIAKGPVINVWYGPSQSFGQLGNPQEWVNILGNVSDPDGIASLTYSLNGGPQMSLSIGPDGRRLQNDGDFNIELAYTDLNDGANQVVITATDNSANQNVENVTVYYTSGNIWPFGYQTDWGSANSIAEQAQIVDGVWALVGDGIRSIVPGYDRLVAIGDIAWQDYEVTVPITLHSNISNDDGVGIVVRWQGHFLQSNEQPRTGWQRIGAYGYYNYENGIDRYLALRLDGTNPPRDYSVQLDLDTRYIYKLRVETSVPGQGGYYSLKVWEDGEPEPNDWQMTAQDGQFDLSTGSLLLVAHNVDATFGDVSVVPLSNITVTLDTSVEGSGSVAKDPDQAEYNLGQEVALTANPSPGWEFVGWSGNLTGNDNPTTIEMTGNKVVTATFAHMLSVGSIGSGSVIAEPDLPFYDEGEEVTLTATGDPEWEFSSWSGDLTGSANPATLTMDGNKVVTATFSPVTTYTLSLDSSGSGTIMADPNQPHYSAGEVVTLTASADPGWFFSSWSGDLTGSANPATVTMDSDRAVTAIFMPTADYKLFLTAIRR